MRLFAIITCCITISYPVAADALVGLSFLLGARLGAARARSRVVPDIIAARVAAEVVNGLLLKYARLLDRPAPAKLCGPNIPRRANERTGDLARCPTG